MSDIASEMSEQIKQDIDAGQFARAMFQLASAWNDSSEFGTLHCTLPEYPEIWVRFKARGYPFSLRRRWDEAKSDVDVMDIILGYVIDWNVPDVEGQPIALLNGARDVSSIDNMDEALITWLIRAFYTFWRVDLISPRKNSSPPSVGT